MVKMSRERASRRFYRADSCSNMLNMMDRGMLALEENRWTFEIAWEAANKGEWTSSSADWGSRWWARCNMCSV